MPSIMHFHLKWEKALKMTEYNFKGTYEPGSLDEVVGEAKELPSKSRRDIIIKNVKVAALIGAGGFIGAISNNYLWEPTKSVTSIEDLLLRTLFIGGMLTGLYTIINYAYKRDWSKASELSPGLFLGFTAGYNLGEMVSPFLK